MHYIWYTNISIDGKYYYSNIQTQYIEQTRSVPRSSSLLASNQKVGESRPSLVLSENKPSLPVHQLFNRTGHMIHQVK